MHLNVFLSFYQIHEEHFRGLAKTTVYNRLSKLIRAGFITTIRVNLVATHKDRLDIGVIYKITKKGLRSVSQYLKSDHIRDDLVPISLGHLYHDLLLSDVIRKIKERFTGLKIVNTKVLKGSNRYGVQEPDAILFSPNTNEKIAVELELTAKSESRYRDIITNYRTNSDFKKVIYVTLNNAIHKKVGGVVTGHGSRYEFTDNSDEFYFDSVSNFFSGDAFKISNGKDFILTKSNNSKLIGEYKNEL